MRAIALLAALAQDLLGRTLKARNVGRDGIGELERLCRRQRHARDDDDCKDAASHAESVS